MLDSRWAYRGGRMLQAATRSGRKGHLHHVLDNATDVYVGCLYLSNSISGVVLSTLCPRSRRRWSSRRLARLARSAAALLLLLVWASGTAEETVESYRTLSYDFVEAAVHLESSNGFQEQEAAAQAQHEAAREVAARQTSDLELAGTCHHVHAHIFKTAWTLSSSCHLETHPISIPS